MQRATVAAVVSAAMLLPANPAFGQTEPLPADWYDNTDPHNLIGHYDYMTGRTNDFDTWEVWVCDPIGPSSFSSLNRFVAFTPRIIVDWIEERSQIEQYFAWLSDGKYKPRFRIGSVVTPDMSDGSFDTYTTFVSRRDACRDAIMADSESSHDGLLIVDTARAFYSTIGSGWTGSKYCASREECDPYPVSGRSVYVDGSVWTDTYIHEIGHAINWPHSYFHDGEQENPNEYTNPMDVMSGSVGWVGTTAINRYAAGWVNPDDVYVWQLGDSSMTLWLDPIGVTGNYQMLVIRDSHTTFYFTFGARIRERFDIHVPKEGVEGYIVDESEDAGCDWESWDWCPGTGRAVNTLGSEPYSTDHVLAVGETTFVLLWDGNDWVEVDVEVLERSGSSFKVRISN